MSISFNGADLKLSSGASRRFAWKIRDAIEDDGIVLVLLDPDAYLVDPAYRETRRSGFAAIQNLVAVDEVGNTLWEAEMPELADYYYRFVSANPLMVDSFSSYRCQIDTSTGKIVRKEFFK